MNGLEQLLDNPPLKSTTYTMEDGRDCLIHELPIAVIEQVQRIGEDGSAHWDDIVQVVARALAGRKPTDKERQAVREQFGASTVMAVYMQALKFSRLSGDAIEQEKKD